MIKKLLSLCSILIFLLFTGCFQKTVDSSKLEKRNGTVYQVGEKKAFYRSNEKLLFKWAASSDGKI